VGTPLNVTDPKSNREFTAYTLARRLRASWMEARVTKAALDLDDFGSEQPEQVGAIGAGEHARQVAASEEGNRVATLD
jgi:hypothetical protein